MTDHARPTDDASHAMRAALTVEGAVQDLCRATLGRPDLRPA